MGFLTPAISPERRGRKIFWRVASATLVSLDGLDEGEELRAVDQLDGFAGGEVLGVTGEFAGGDDYGFVGLLGGHQTEHFTDDGCADGKYFPLLALHQRGLACAVQL